MKKIAILTERLKTGFGVDLVVHEQAKRLAKKCETTVFAIEIDDEYDNKHNYSTYKLRIPLHFNPIVQDLESFKHFHKYKHILKQFDSFIIQTPTFNSWIPKLKKFGKVIVHYYGNSPSNKYPGLKKYRKQIFDFVENNFYFNFADEIITISSFLKSNISQKHHSKTHVIYLGADHVKEIFNTVTTRKRNEILKYFFIDKNEKMITYIGRLDYFENPYKNTYDLIKLRRSLDKSGFNKTKILAIGFPQNQIEKKMFATGISVVSRATNQELTVLLEASYLYFSPSLWEGFNLPFVEAQALGVPALGYDVGAHQEVVNNRFSGTLVKSFPEMVLTIKKLLKSEEERQRMSQEALIKASSYTWDKNVEMLERFL